MMLLSEGFMNINMLSTIVFNFIGTFETLKDQKLYPQKKIENNLDVNPDSLNPSDLRRAVKLACILKNQEFTNYFKKVIDQDKAEYDSVLDHREFVVSQTHLGDWWVKSRNSEYYL